jgi:hypothetical protein
MTKDGLNAGPWTHGSCLLIVLALGLGGAADARAADWTVELQPVFMEAYGHDQHVLTVHQITPASDTKTAVSLDTGDTFAYRGEFQYHGAQWIWGVDFLWFVTTQNADPRTAAGGPVDKVAFEVADRTFTSSDPRQVLFYRVLEDTDLELWTLDFYGMKTLAERPESALRLQLGLRLGDFDNDYHAAVGIEGVAGARLDASSNYDRLMGPLVGLAGDAHFGKNSLTGYLSQSVLFGTAEKLTSTRREFTGPFGPTPAFGDSEGIRREGQDVAIPISELRIKWAYQLTRRISLGAGVHSSVWWDVPVPPGVVPIAGGDSAFHENTIVLVGVLGAVKVTF